MRDFARFAEDNVNWKALRKRVPWEQRLKMIQEEFPGTRDPDWNQILKDPDIFARLLRDVLKVDQLEFGQPGPRPNLDPERGMRTWNEIRGDYSERPFIEAFAILVRGNSLRTIARKTGISKTRVVRLQQGDDRPSAQDLRAIAEAYNKKPAYFVEYRAEYILASIATRLQDEHELTAALYRKLVQ
jgi:Helix-turn-helix domain